MSLMRENRFRTPLPLMALALLAMALEGCAALERIEDVERKEAEAAVGECVARLGEIDGLIDANGVRDAEAARVPGFPYLRVDRLTASFNEDARRDDRKFGAWVDLALGRDREGREVELANLPRGAVDKGIRERVFRCSEILRNHDTARAEFRSMILDRAVVPDDYKDWQRVVGAYALTKWPFALGVQGWHEEALRQFASADPKNLVRYAPQSVTNETRSPSTALMRAYANAGPLGIPAIPDDDANSLLDLHAPVFDVETTGSFDRIGEVVWTDGPRIEPSRPILYRRLTFTRFGPQVLPQLVYTVWFSERPSDGPNDILAGLLDGVVLRVTLTPDGVPLVYDSIHPCGCYHMFFPTAKLTPKPAPGGVDEWAFIPKTLPVMNPGERVVVRIASRTHYVTGVAPARNIGEAIIYGSRDENTLRRLPLADGGTKSLYGPDGLVEASERPERMLFWPMGIPSAGTMRQWGHHATAFLGRRHFDDADLLERRFQETRP